MKNLCWKGKAFKALSYGKNSQKAGRNFSGSITIFHRGGGSKKLLRRIDFHRAKPARGLVERIEYDPNRTARIALVRWSNIIKSNDSVDISTLVRTESTLPLGRASGDVRSYASAPCASGAKPLRGRHAKPLRAWQVVYNAGPAMEVVYNSYDYESEARSKKKQASRPDRLEEVALATRPARAFSYILAPDQLKSGDEVLNIEDAYSSSLDCKQPRGLNQCASKERWSNEQQQLYQKSGNAARLWMVPLGTLIHNIELCPGGGGALARAAGTSAQLVQKLTIINDYKAGNQGAQHASHLLRNGVYSTSNVRQHAGAPPSEAALAMKPKKLAQCIIRLPSGQQQLVDLRCRATIGCVSNMDHRSQKLRKAGQTRWLGFRPTVRGVAMNPIDHPHGGGEGRTKGGRPSVSPWGKPAKGARRRPIFLARTALGGRVSGGKL